ncbi:hypothetical protein [Desulfosporosinus sp. SB140]|uniref:hypothetical protein n=1 Tax=Desulfosporosinus paludis TaxID=3115649 RepID=UPI003890E425
MIRRFSVRYSYSDIMQEIEDNRRIKTGEDFEFNFQLISLEMQWGADHPPEELGGLAGRL